MTAPPRSRRLILALALPLGAPLAVGVACGSSPAPVLGNSTGTDSGYQGGDAPIGAGDAGSDAAAPPDAGSLDVGSGDAASDVGPDRYDAGPPPPVCSPEAGVGSTTSLVLGTPDPDLMGGVSDDDLVIAWTSLPDGGPVVHWAERAQKTDPFGQAETLDPQFGVPAPDHVALRGDGLRLVFVSADRSHLFEIGRTARGTPFATDDTGESFEGVNPTTEGSNVNPGLSPFGQPSLASSFKTMWAFIHGTAGFAVSESELGVWSPPSFPPSLSPPASDPYKTLPTGWSADGRTLFYWDNAEGVERAAWRDPFSITFTGSKDLGTVEQYATPSADCTELYFSAAGAAGDLDVFVAAMQ